MQNDKVELWGDVVSLNQLLISIFISIICTMGLYFLAPQDDKSKQLFFGLIGSVISFIITSLIFKPKRNVKVHK